PGNAARRCAGSRPSPRSIPPTRARASCFQGGTVSMSEPITPRRGILYTHRHDGSIGVAVTGDLHAPPRFTTYPFAVRARVRIASTLGHHADEEQKLSYAFAVSTSHYAAVLDDLLCACA